MPVIITKFIKFSRKYRYFLKCCRKNLYYKKYINSSKNSNGDIFIIINQTPIGVLEVNSINLIDSNLALNIFLKNDNFLMKMIVLFRAIGFVFEKYKVHKVILKIYERNTRINNILKKINIKYEGYITVDFYNKVYIYSILENEYLKFNNLKWRELFYLLKN
jgi:hypothetical protein